MEPLTHSDKQRLLAENPRASLELIDEYELLLVEMFANPPRPQMSRAAREKIDQRNRRIQELRDLLFNY